MNTAATLPSPVLIIGPQDHDPDQLHELAALAITEGRVPIVIHPTTRPWYDGNKHAASKGMESVLAMVGRHTGGRLWLLLQDGESLDNVPVWCKGIVGAWRRHAGRMPSRMRVGSWDAWAPAVRARCA